MPAEAGLSSYPSRDGMSEAREEDDRGDGLGAAARGPRDEPEKHHAPNGSVVVCIANGPELTNGPFL